MTPTAERRAGYQELKDAIQDVRADVHVFHTDVSRVLRLLEGNGQPGFIKETNARFAALEQFKWKMIGGLLAWSAFLTLVAVFVNIWTE